VILFLLACSKNDGTETPYLVADEHEQQVPSFEPDTIESSMDEAIAVFRSLDTAPIIAAYDAAMAEADDSCPAWYTTDGMPFWSDSCTTKAGTKFDGYGYEVQYGAGMDDGYAVWSGTAIGSVANIETADGETLAINGVVYDLQGVVNENGSSVRYTEISGDISYPGNPNPGLVPVFKRSVYDMPGGVAVLLDGSVSGLSGDLEATAFDNVYLVDEGTGLSDCNDEPSGVISVLETSGGWIDLVFDPQVEDNAIETQSASSCDGCAAAWWGSQYLGQACADFSPWLVP
jgi:hypothetical protein